MVRTFTIWKIWSRRYLLFTRERSINANDTGYNLSTFRIIDAKTYLINHFCRDRLQYIDPSQISSKIRIKNWFQKCLIPIILSLTDLTYSHFIQCNKDVPYMVYRKFIEIFQRFREYNDFYYARSWHHVFLNFILHNQIISIRDLCEERIF